MTGNLSTQRRSICTLTGMAVGFRAFYAVIVDGAPMYGSRWIPLLGGVILAIVPLSALVVLRRKHPEQSAEYALMNTVGKSGTIGIGITFFVLLTYDAGAVLRFMSSTAKYVAIPNGSNLLIMAVTMICAVVAVGMGVAAVANAAVMWRKLSITLIGLLIIVQIGQFRAAWLAPIWGTGCEVLLRESIPVGGIFSFAAAGWLLMESEHDKRGTALLRTVITSGVVTAGLAAVFCMLVPGLVDELPTRSFRLGRLLANDRAGLSLEMPYVILLYSGMLTILLFEITVAAKCLRWVFPKIHAKWSAWAVGILAFVCAASGLAERDWVQKISMWYYPIGALPMGLAGICALRSGKRRIKS